MATLDTLLERMMNEPEGEETVEGIAVGDVAEAVFERFPPGSGVSFGIDGEVEPIKVTWRPAPESA